LFATSFWFVGFHGLIIGVGIGIIMCHPDLQKERAKGVGLRVVNIGINISIDIPKMKTTQKMKLSNKLYCVNWDGYCEEFTDKIVNCLPDKIQNMKTKEDLERDIRSITSTIHQEFPELSKYIKEMPDNNADERQVSLKNLEEYHQSLVELVNRYADTHEGSKTKKDSDNSLNSGYPLYPPSQDIFSQGKEEKDLNPEDISKRKAPNEKEGARNEKDFQDDKSGDDLDVPGSELDDQQESVGSEDEENNYYSLGGDNHNDLEEGKA
jgi:hypothetical protein